MNISAQSLERFIIGSAGLSIQNNDITLSFTIGEAVTGSNDTETLQLSQGFQQAGKETTTGIELPEYPGNFIIYPNPAGDQFYLKLISANVSAFSLDICDINGRKLMLSKITIKGAEHSQHRYDLSDLVQGIYLVKIRAINGSFSKVVKIIKK